MTAALQAFSDGLAVRILEVAEGSPAAAAGMRRGDLVVAAAGAPVETLDDVVRGMVPMVLGHPEELGLELVRDGRRTGVRIRPRPPEARAA